MVEESATNSNSWLKLIYTYPLLVLSALFLLVVFFIFNHITGRSLWLDEALVANSLKVPFLKIYTQVIYSNQSILYLYVIKLWSLVFGESELALRSFSAFFAWLLVVLMYFSGKVFFKNKTVGFWAATLASTNYFLIWFGTQVRPYTFSTFLGLLSYFFFIKTLRQRCRKNFLFYVLSTVLSLYTHPWAFLVFFTQAVIAGFYFRDKPRLQLFLIQLLIIFLALPSLWIVFFLGQSNVTSWLKPPNLGVFWESLKYLSYGSGWVYLGLSLTAIFCLPFAKKLNTKTEIWLIPSLFLYFVLPLGLAWLVSQIRPAYAVGRYEIMVLPAFLLLLSRFWSSMTHRYMVVVAILVLMGFCYNSIEMDRKMIAGYQTNDRLLAQKLLKRIKPEDTVITTDLSWASMTYYFSRLPHIQSFLYLSYPQEISQEHPCWENIDAMVKKSSFYEREAVILAEKLKARGGVIWVLFKEGNPINELLIKELNKRFKLVSNEPLPSPRQPMWLDAVLIFKTSDK